jgi:pyruvate dehydrogenase E2 component (dihydrolipoamide acetyltransferase)
VIVVLDASGATASEPAQGAAPAPAAAPAAEPTAASAVGDIKEQLPGMGGSGKASAPAASGYFSDKPLAAPATRKMARELGVDLRQVSPTGEAGRVTKDDVQRAAAGGVSAPGAAASATAMPVPAAVAVPATALEERLPMRGIRKRMFESMARSKRTAAHFTYVDECECTALIALRKRLLPLAESQGVKLTFLPFIIKAIVAALKKHPQMNCLFDETTQELVLRKNFDLGIAVATDNGLVVPVLRRADQRNLLELAREIDRLASEARTGKVSREDLGGSSFTVTSLGKAGGLLATPVVNLPEVGILYIPQMKKRPIVVGDEIKIGHVMDLSLSFDHRIVDGHLGATFTQTVIELLTEPDRLLLEL